MGICDDNKILRQAEKNNYKHTRPNCLLTQKTHSGTPKEAESMWISLF